MFLIIYLILSGCYCISASDKSVPLLLWGVEAPKFPALHTIQSEEFQQIIRDLLEKYTLNLYVESELTPQDFFCRNATTHESCFRFLQKVNPSTYYMKVKNPVGSIDALHSINWTQFNSSTSFNCSVGTVHGFNFPDIYDQRKQRKQQLQSHDALMEKFINETHCPVVHIYTAHNHRNTSVRMFSLPRLMRNLTEINDNFFRTDKFAIRFRRIFYKRGMYKFYAKAKTQAAQGPSNILEEVTVLDISISPKENDEYGYLVSFDATPIKFTMDLYTPSSYKGVRIRTFRVDNIISGTSPFNIPNKYSYVCNTIEVLCMDKSLLILDHVQMEAILYNVTSDQFRFSKPIYCTGILTPNIMGGLFIGLLIISIVGWGILCILDIGINKYMGSSGESEVAFGANE